MKGPIERLSERLNQSWMASGAFVIGSFLATIPFLWLARLPSPQPGMPGIALEFPGTANTALAILRAFDTAALIGDARTAILWDFLLIIAYTSAFTSLLEWLARGERGSRDELLPYAIQGVLRAGVLDVLENLGMLTLLLQVGHPQEARLGITALITTLVALLKWTLVLAVAGYSLWELAKRIASRMGFTGPTSERARGRAPQAPATGGDVFSVRVPEVEVFVAEPATSRKEREEELVSAG